MKTAHTHTQHTHTLQPGAVLRYTSERRKQEKEEEEEKKEIIKEDSSTSLTKPTQNQTCGSF